MAGTDVSKSSILSNRHGQIVRGINEAEQLTNLTIIHFAKDLLDKDIHCGGHLTQPQIKRLFRRCVSSIFANGDARREFMHQQAECPAISDFWEDQCDPKTGQSRMTAPDPGQSRTLERDEITANGVQVIMSDGDDDILVSEVEYLNLENVLYVDVVKLIHESNPRMSISEDKMQRIWTSVVYNMNHHESEELKAMKLGEMDSPEARRYWDELGRNVPMKTSQEGASTTNGPSNCENCRQPVPHMPLSDRSLSPPPDSEWPRPNHSPANANGDRNTTTGGSSRPGLEDRPVSPMPISSQTAQPFPMFPVSLGNQPVPSRPSFSQTGQPRPMVTVSLPQHTARNFYLGSMPSHRQAPQPPRVLSRPSWPLTSPSEQAFPPVSAAIPPTRRTRPRTNRRLWVPSPRNGFTLRTRSGDLHVPGEA